ncbi:hypothetical protein PVAG01_08781 [Phlyctema vagabunda]|uniref:F-box domain-containing protein n=1 Tax=Phlyctema vagabunda TaxID=108571 RepID=A0ABR4PAI6_9HELO
MVHLTPSLLGLPLELRHYIYEALICRGQVDIMDADEWRDDLEQLSRTCASLRGEITEWREHARDLKGTDESPVIGLFRASQTEFVVHLNATTYQSWAYSDRYHRFCTHHAYQMYRLPRVVFDISHIDTTDAPWRRYDYCAPLRDFFLLDGIRLVLRDSRRWDLRPEMVACARMIQTFQSLVVAHPGLRLGLHFVSADGE